MKGFLFLLCIIVSYIALTNAKAAEDVKKAIETVNKAKVVLGKVNEIILKANPAKIFMQVSKVLAFLGPAMMVVSAVMSIVAVFLPKEDSPELKALKEGFDKVNRKLDMLTSDIKDLKNIVELSSAKSTYAKCITSIESNFEVLESAQKTNTKSSYEYFAKHYEMSYDLAAANLYDAMTGQLGPFGFNLVNLYKDYVKCNPVLVNKFCTSGMQILSKGLAVEGAYMGVQNLTVKAQMKQETWEKKLLSLGESCQAIVQNCEDNWKISASQQFREIYNRERDSNNHDLASKLAEGLNAVVPQRAWMAVSYHDSAGFGEHGFTSFYEKDEIWNQHDKDVTIFSAPLETEIIYNSLQSVKAKVETQKNKIATTSDCTKHFGGQDTRSLIAILRDAFMAGVIYIIRSDKEAGYAATGNTFYDTDLYWKCSSKNYKVLAFV